MRKQIPYTLRADSVYFKIRQDLLRNEFHGTVATLPLFFEYTSTSNELRKFLDETPTIAKYMQVVTPQEVKKELEEKQSIFAVHSTQIDSFTYIPQVISSKNWHLHSSHGSRLAPIRVGTNQRIENQIDENAYIIPNIIIKINSTARCFLYDLADIDFQKDDKYYGLAELNTYSLSTHIKTQIYTRYYAPSRSIDDPTIYLENTYYKSLKNKYIVDSYLPFTACISEAIPVYNSTTLAASKRQQFLAISPLTADLLGFKRLHLNDILVDILEISLDEIYEILLKVKRRKLTINFAGTGGTGINTIYWLYELTKLCGIENLFKEINLFETDCIDLSNIFRFPLPLSTYTQTSMPASKKVNLITPYAQDLCKVLYCYDNYLTCIDDFPSVQLTPELKAKPGIITYGAPSVANRNFLSSVGQFISGTHANNTASLYINPVADETLQVETYGLIQLNSFFINQIRMAIGFLELLAEERESDQDTLYQDYTFTPGKIIGDYVFNIDTEMQAREITGGN